MILHSPFEISARLLPAVRVGKATISIEIAGTTGEGRTCFRYFLDTPDFGYFNDDLKSGCHCGGTIQEGMQSLLGFLVAAGEEWDCDSKGDCESGFPDNVSQWAYQNSDELSMLECELQENKNLVEGA